MPERLLTRCRDIPGLRSIDVYLQHGGYDAVRKALTTHQPEELVEMVKASNLRGRGGFLPKQTEKPVYLCVNADESEPGTFKDRLILEDDPHQLLEGVIISAYAIKCRLAYIYIRGEMLLGYERLWDAVREAHAKGFLGKNILGTGFDLDVVIHRGAGAYICGEETALLESLEGKRGQPRSKPPFPAISGVYASPTLINNVESITTIPSIFAVGPAEYAKIGAPPDSTGTRLFCLSGNVARPGVYEAPHGITVRHLIYDIGGGVPDGHTLKAVMMGGSSFPVMTPDDLDTPLDADSLGKKGYFIGSGVVTVIDERTCIVQFALRVAQFYMHESCGKCTPCRVGTRWLVQLMRAVEEGTASERDLELTLDVCDRIIGKCLCVLGDSAAMPVASCVTKFRDEFREHLEHGGCPFGADSQLAGLFAPVDQHEHTAVPQEALV